MSTMRLLSPQTAARLPAARHALRRLLSSSPRERGGRRSRGADMVLPVEAVTVDGAYSLPTCVHRPPAAAEGSGSAAAVSTLPPVLLVSGWTGIASDWGAIPSMLASRLGRDIVTYDARGVGDSSPVDTSPIVRENRGRLPLDGLSLEQMASDALCVVKAADERRRKEDALVGGGGIPNDLPLSFCVGGASMGGMVAQLLAGAAHGHVRLPCGRNNNGGDFFELTSMALICTSSRAPSPSARDFLDSFDSWSADNDAEEDNRRCADRFFELGLGESFLRRPGRTRLRERLTDGFVAGRTASVNACGTGVEAQKRALMQFPKVGGTDTFLPHVGKHVPSIVVHGKDDRVIPHESAMHMKRLLGSETSLSSIEDCDHLLWITHGLELIDILGDFFTKSPLFLQDRTIK